MYTQQVQGRIAGLTAKVAKSAVCAYTVTPDHHFIIDKHPRLQHTLVVSPCSGHGFKHSAALGKVLNASADSGKLRSLGSKERLKSNGIGLAMGSNANDRKAYTNGL